ncbi:hypothetical protein FGO68_gene3765 [Halteria grandinella]|uniref:Uncharacterized protein n=1 Tax=Halteria grandinella TaxID=5974 RepID=A0A8J8NL22_HALGN|nr:hypothetical protein FGO68_gene3765 [Halteria grandinella]
MQAQMERRAPATTSVTNELALIADLLPNCSCQTEKIEFICVISEKGCSDQKYYCKACTKRHDHKGLCYISDYIKEFKNQWINLDSEFETYMHKYDQWCKEWKNLFEIAIRLNKHSNNELLNQIKEFELTYNNFKQQKNQLDNFYREKLFNQYVMQLKKVVEFQQAIGLFDLIKTLSIKTLMKEFSAVFLSLSLTQILSIAGLKSIQAVMGFQLNHKLKNLLDHSTSSLSEGLFCQPIEIGAQNFVEEIERVLAFMDEHSAKIGPSVTESKLDFKEYKLEFKLRMQEVGKAKELLRLEFYGEQPPPKFE